MIGLSAQAASSAEFHVSPGATLTGDGSASHPWPLQIALNHPRSLTPGDTIWIRGGIYTGAFTSKLKATPTAPIIVRAQGRQRVVLDMGSNNGPPLTVRSEGGWTTYQDLEVTSSDAVRLSRQTGSFPTDIARAGRNGTRSGIDVFAPGTKLINVVAHDAGGGFWLDDKAAEAELYGCIAFHNGWEAPDRGHGHGIYTHGDANAGRTISECIVFNQFSHGLHTYSGKAIPALNNVSYSGNILFNNGSLSAATGYARNFLHGGDLALSHNVTLLSNYTYYPQTTPPAQSFQNANIGYAAGVSGLTARGNIFAGLVALKVFRPSGLISLEGNVFYGSSLLGVNRDEFPGNTYYLQGARPTGLHAFVRANRYEPGRAHIVVYNWDRLSEVQADISAAGLNAGDSFELTDVQNFFGPPVAAGTYSGRPLRIPMAGLSAPVTLPVGNAPISPAHTSPEFGVFLLRRSNSTSPSPRPRQ